MHCPSVFSIVGVKGKWIVSRKGELLGCCSSSSDSAEEVVVVARRMSAMESRSRLPFYDRVFFREEEVVDESVVNWGLTGPDSCHCGGARSDTALCCNLTTTCCVNSSIIHKTLENDYDHNNCCVNTAPDLRTLFAKVSLSEP
jgi:hypothetical protein